MSLPPHNERPAETPVPPDVGRRWLVAGAVVTAAAALGTLAFSRLAALGILIGGAAGTAAFGLLARQASSLRGGVPAETVRRMYFGVVQRLVIYAGALLAALALDPRRLRAFAGAAAGLILVRTAAVAVGAVDARRIVRRLSSDPKRPRKLP